MLSKGLSKGLSNGLSYWLLLGLIQGVSHETIENQHRMLLNQGIRRSALNGLVFGLIGTVIVGLLGWLNIRLSSTLHDILFSALPSELLGVSWLLTHFELSAGPLGLLTGLVVGLVVGLLYGGLASLRHYLLRFLLWRAGVMPWHYTQFLDAAAERILLRKVGGGYMFVHRLLLEYFVSLDNTHRRDEAKE